MKIKRNNQTVTKLSDEGAESLRKITDQLQQEVKVVIDDVVSKEITEKIKQAAIKDIEAKALTADTDLKQWLADTLPQVYVAGVKSADILLREFNIKIKGGTFSVEVLKAGNTTHLQAVNNLLSDAYMDFGHGINGFVKGARHVLNDAFKRQLAQQMAMGRLDGASINEIRKEMQALLQKQNFTALIDKGGRSWALSDYSEMLARTHMIRANTDATVNRCFEYDVDIVEVSTHGADDALCAPEEGKVYSLSGNSKEYEKITEFPPYHPNCKHTLLPRPDLT